jgi:hypothetical protein
MCMMLGASLTVSRLASSSSDSSGSKSTMASPSPVPHVVIFVVLPDISKVLEVELMPQDDAIETGPRTETSASEFFFKFDIGCAGARGRGDGAADPRQVVQRRLSAGVVDENDGQILDCLEHVRHH